MNQTIIIVTDDRCGSAAFNSMDEFKAAMIGGRWTEEDFQEFIDNSPEVNDAELIRSVDNGGLYVYEESYNTGYGRYESRHHYYLVWNDGAIRYVDTLDHPADAKELEMFQK